MPVSQVTVNIKRNWTWHNFWNLLTINLKVKSFHNFIEWSNLNSRLNLQVKIYSVFRLLENAFIIYDTPPPPWHNLIIN